MSVITQLLIIIATLFVLILLGCPVFACLGCTSAIAVWLFFPKDLTVQFATIAYQQGTSINQLIPPMFILMAEFLAKGGVADDIFRALNYLLGKIRGGLAMATTLACTIFAALCGSSPATAAAMGKISIGSMTKRKYQKGFAVGTVAGAGTLGILIPPSLTLVGYGILTETSIVKLLMAGLVPGILVSLMMIASIAIRARISPHLVGVITPEFINSKKYKPDQYAMSADELLAPSKEDEQLHADKKERYRLFVSVIPALVLIIVVLGSMYTGICTASESAALGALGAFLIVAFGRRLNKRDFLDTLRSAARNSTMIIFLTVAGLSLSFVLSFLKIPSTLTTMLVEANVNKWVLIAGLYVMWLVLGCLMDPGSMTMLTIPFLFDSVIALGFDPIWLGIVSVIATEIGMISPPVGLNLFVLKANTDIEMKHIMTGCLPYIGVLLLALVLFTVFPGIVTFVPSRM